MIKFLIQLVIIVVGLMFGDRASAQELKNVSMIQLIASPQSLNGQRVRVIGYLHLEFETSGVYLHREDFEKLIIQNGVSIELSDAQLSSWGKLNNKYVIIEAKFSADDKGHLGIWSGSLKDVTRLDSWTVSTKRR